MNERDYARKWIERFKKDNLGVWIWNIPDSPVGRKPFDCVACINGSFVAIEFKIKGRKLELHQEWELNKVKKNGGIAKVISFGKQGEIEEVIL